MWNSVHVKGLASGKRLCKRLSLHLRVERSSGDDRTLYFSIVWFYFFGSRSWTGGRYFL